MNKLLWYRIALGAYCIGGVLVGLFVGQIYFIPISLVNPPLFLLGCGLVIIGAPLYYYLRSEVY